jgi:hypothetical protein
VFCCAATLQPGGLSGVLMMTDESGGDEKIAAVLLQLKIA